MKCLEIKIIVYNTSKFENENLSEKFPAETDFSKNRSLVKLVDPRDRPLDRRRPRVIRLPILTVQLALPVLPLQHLAPALEQVLLQRILEGELLAAVRAAVVDVGLGNRCQRTKIT